MAELAPVSAAAVSCTSTGTPSASNTVHSTRMNGTPCASFSADTSSGAHTTGQVRPSGQSGGICRTFGLPTVPVRELLDRLTIRGLEILPARIRHGDQRSLLHLGVIDAKDRRELFLELDVDLRPG